MRKVRDSWHDGYIARVMRNDMQRSDMEWIASLREVLNPVAPGKSQDLLTVKMESAATGHDLSPSAEYPNERDTLDVRVQDVLIRREPVSIGTDHYRVFVDHGRRLRDN